VLQRNRGEVQLGVDSQAALIFAEPRLSTVLLALDGAHHIGAIREVGLAEGLGADVIDDVLKVLDETQMLVEGGRCVRPPEAVRGRSVCLIGAGQLGKSIARLLVQAGIGRLCIIDDERCTPDVYPGYGPPPTQAEALRAMISEDSATMVRTARHWTHPWHSPLDLTVLAGETAEADRLIATDLLNADRAHLVVRSAGEAVVVGPLVVPGRTACLTCTDLSRRDADPAWPALLDQLTRLRLPATDLLNAWAASTTATQVLAFLRGGTPEACGATIELHELDLITRWRRWTSHPECGCHWFSVGQWGT
jgi:hypothetical protein